jgi:hypothetical protein
LFVPSGESPLSSQDRVSSPIILSSSDEEAQPKIEEEPDDSEWFPFDENGICTFCYFCLDAAGIELYLCDNKCPNAIHMKCCRKLDKSLGLTTTLSKNSNWECHYCREVIGLKYSDPVKSFCELVGNVVQEKSVEKTLPTASKPTRKRKKPFSSPVISSMTKKKQRK